MHKLDPNTEKLEFFFTIVTKYITRHVLLVNLFTLYVIYNIGITQKPSDHLFQKLRASGFNLRALTRKQTKIDKFEGFFFVIVTKYIAR